MANLNNRMQIKRTYVSGRLPNTTDPSNSQYIAAGEFALNMPDRTLYTSDGQLLITVGSTASVLRVSDSISIGDVSNNLLSINSSAIFAGNTSVSTSVRTTSVAVQNSSSNISISPTTIFVGNNSSNVTVDMTGGNLSIPISLASIDSNAVVTIQTSYDHGITTLTQSKLFVNTSQVSLNTANYSSDYNPIGFDIRAIPTPNTISFALPNDSFKGVAPGNRTIASIDRAANGVVTVVTNGPHYYSNGDLVYASGVSYDLADFYISGGSVAKVINSTTLTYTQNNYASSTRSLVGAKSLIYTPKIPGYYYFWIEAADPVFNGFIKDDYITYSGLPETIASPGFRNNAYSPSYFNGNLLIDQVQVNNTGYKTVLVFVNEIQQNEIRRYLYPESAPYILTQGAVVISYVESGRVNNNSQLCPVLTSASISGSIVSSIPTGISIKNGSKLVYVLDSIVFVGNSTIGNIVDSKGSRAYRPNVINADPVATYTAVPTSYLVNEGSSVVINVTTTNFGSGTLYWTNIGTTTGADFTNGLNSGSINIAYDYGYFTLNLSNDVALEGPQSIKIQIHTGSTSGPVVATTDSISVNDTSFPPTYEVSASTRSINEGGSVSFYILTTGIANGTTLYWTNGGTTIASDFDNNLNSGSFTITDGAATVTKTLANDFVTEPGFPETILFQVRDSTGTLKVTAPTVTVNDTSVESYSVSVNSTNVNEGQTVTFTVATRGIPTGTTLYWSLGGTIQGYDFTNTNGLTYGTISTTGDSTAVPLILANDLTEDGSKTMLFLLRKDSYTSTVLAYSAVVTVADTSKPTYSVLASTGSVNEGQSVTFTVTTTGIATGTTLYWSNEGTTINDDFTDGFNAGSFTIDGSGVGTITRTLSNDLLLENVETIRLQIRTGSTTGPAVTNGLSASVNVIDTSIPAVSYVVVSVTPSVTSVNEGSSVVFTVVTTGVPNGTTMYWKNIGTTISSDFSDDKNLDSFTIDSSGRGYITRTLTNDRLTEGTETIALEIYKDSIDGTLLYNPVALSKVNVSDTSTGTYAVTATPSNVDEGASVVFTVTTTGIPAGTVLNWAITNPPSTVSADDFTDGKLTGSITVQISGIATISKTLVADALSEGPETIIFSLFDSTGTDKKAEVNVIVNDTSKSIIPTYEVTASATSVTEGGTITFNITTTNVAVGTLLNWTIGGGAPSGTVVNASDFVTADRVLSGSFNVTSSGLYTLSKTLLIDGVNEGAEYFYFKVLDSTSSNVLSYVQVNVNDTNPTYALSATVSPTRSPVTTVNEGDSITFTFNTTNIPVGTTLYWYVEGLSANMDYFDFQDGNGLSGSFNVTDTGTFTLNKTIKLDSLTENTQYFSMVFKDTTFIEKARMNFTVIDTSVYVAPIYSYSFVSPAASQSIYRNGTIIYILSGSIGTTINYTVKVETVGGTSVAYPVDNRSYTFTSNAPTLTLVVYNNATYFNPGPYIVKAYMNTTSPFTIRASAPDQTFLV